MVDTTASTAVATPARDNDERAAMRAQNSVRFTASLRCAFGRGCSTMREALSSAPRRCGLWREVGRRNARRTQRIGVVTGAASR